MKLYPIIYLLLIYLSFTACKKFVDINPPKNQLVTASVFESNETANASLLTIYAAMEGAFNTSPYHIPLYTGIYADELTNNNGGLATIYINGIEPENSFISSFWNEAYKYIYLANAVYEGCNASSSLDPDVKKQLMAESVFIRAYWYFYLVNLYGDVPLVTDVDYTKNSTLPRSAATEVYNQIVKDLAYAQANLNENYVGSNSITTTDERVRPNKYAAAALLARVYLYLGRNSDAELAATTVINQSGMYDLVAIDEVFLKNSKEAIWQVMPPNNSSINTPEGYGFIPTGAPPAGGYATISLQLMETFEKGDGRAQHWIGVFTDVDAGVDYYFLYKYKIQSGSDLYEYSMMLRLAEQYLIRAEARYGQQNYTGAIADLNVLRDRARAPESDSVPTPLPALKDNLSTSDVKAAILHERQVELFAEQGHRWLDMKRLGVVDGVMGTVCPFKGGGAWNTNKQLWPIPQTEILNDPRLVQNPGYN